jgi:hypothetical protein
MPSNFGSKDELSGLWLRGILVILYWGIMWRIKYSAIWQSTDCDHRSSKTPENEITQPTVIIYCVPDH